MDAHRNLRMPRRTGWLLGTAIVIALALARPAAAGGSADLDQGGGDYPHFFGFVRDSDGNAIADARVDAVLTAGGATLVTRSDATGAYQIPMFNNTDPAKATITCSKQGYRFKELERRDAAPAPGTSAEVNCILAHE